MAKKKGKNKRGKKKFKIHVSGYLVAFGLIEPIVDAIKTWRAGSDAVTTFNRYQAHYTGYDFQGKVWIPELAVTGSVPIGLGMGMNVANKEFEINKKLGQMKVPLIRM